MAKLKWLVNTGNYYYFKEAPTHASAISLNKSSINFTSAGQTEQLVATITPSDAVDKKVIWSSSNTSIAIVSSTGLVTCVTPGSATITATTDDGGLTATCSVKRPQINVELLMVGGGGAGGTGYYYTAGGGGAGGVIQCSNYSLSAGQKSVVIGCGGCISSGGMPSNGGNSTFNGLIAYGGGAGGWYNENSDILYCGCNGGSGGGGPGAGPTTRGGCGCSGQGYNGGNGCGCNSSGGGGGGGAGGAGSNGWYRCGVKGGIGIESDITGTSVWYAGGGSSFDRYDACPIDANCGGAGSSRDAECGVCNAATNNQHYGGGGGATNNFCCGRGHSGILVIRYPSSCGYNITGGTKYLCNGYCIHCFTSNDTLTVN